MYKKLKIEENQLGTLCYDSAVNSFQQSPTSSEETKHSTWALHYISSVFGLLICQFIIILVQIWCTCSMPVFIFLEYWSLSSFFVITVFFFFHCGESEPFAQCNTLLLWMWFWAKLNILNVFCLSKYIILNSVCLVIFLVPNVVKVHKGCSSSLFFVSIFPSVLSVCTFPRSVWVIPYDFFHDI